MELLPSQVLAIHTAGQTRHIQTSTSMNASTPISLAEMSYGSGDEICTSAVEAVGEDQQRLIGAVTTTTSSSLLEYYECKHPDQQSRLNVLQLALAAQGLVLRSDSKLCKRYIEQGVVAGWDAPTIALKLAQMKYLHENTDYVDIKRRLVREEEDRRAMDLLLEPDTVHEAFPILKIKEEAIRLALQQGSPRSIGNSFPQTMPWNKPAARRRRVRLEQELAKVGVELRGDSTLCADYIQHGDSKEWKLGDIVQRMAEMKYLHEYSPYRAMIEEYKRKHAIDWDMKDKEEKRALKRRIEDHITKNGSLYPYVWPWLSSTQAATSTPTTAMTYASNKRGNQLTIERSVKNIHEQEKVANKSRRISFQDNM